LAARVADKTPWPFRLLRGPEESLRTLRERVRPIVFVVLGSTLLPLFFIWAAYGFHYHGPTKSDGTPYYKWQEMEAQTWVGARTLLAARDLHILPEPYAYGFLYLLSQSKGRPGFLLGEIS